MKKGGNRFYNFSFLTSNFSPFTFFLIYCYIQGRGNEMAARVKPVQPTEIKDKKIAREVIAQIRLKPTAAALKRHKAEEEDLIRLLKK
jgi:hypothetical protein